MLSFQEKFAEEREKICLNKIGQILDFCHVCNSFINGSIDMIYCIHTKSVMLSTNNNSKVVNDSSGLSS